MSPNQKPSSPAPQPPTPPFLSIKTAALILLFSILALSALRNFFPRTSSPSVFSSINKSTMTTLTTTTTTNKPLEILPRRWNARGHADHGWLYTYHTFSFANYQDANFSSYGPLRVINEDRVHPGTGFGTHGHAEFLIWSYIVSGELEHRDSMGNVERLRRGQVQFTSAGTGIRHSEFNRNEDEEVHFLQIWSRPDTAGLKPHYVTREFPEERKRDRLVRIMESTRRASHPKDGTAGDGGAEDPIPLHADLSMSASILTPGAEVQHEMVAEGERKIYLHVVMGGRKQAGGARIRVGDVELGEGDGAFVRGAMGPGSLKVESVGDKEAEFLLFDMGMDEK